MTDRVRDLPPARQRLFIVFAIVFGCMVVFAAVEVALRIVPVIPKPQQLDIQIEPGGKYQAPHSELGFRPLAGRYRALFDHRHPWIITNLPDTTRITRTLERYGVDAPQPGIWFFGCSFTQGWGLNDKGTMPWKVQERLPDHDVANFGVGGYGTLQSLLQYHRALKNQPAPEIAILSYGRIRDHFIDPHRVSEHLIEQFIDESCKHGVRFVLAGIPHSDGTRETLRHFAAQGVETVDIATDQNDPHNQIPYDGHPSAFANAQSAKKIVAAVN